METKETYELYKLNLLRLMQERDMSQKTFAAFIGIAESELSRIVNGNIRLTTDRIEGICSRTGIDANEFDEEGLVVENHFKHITVRRSGSEPKEKKKRKRKSNYVPHPYRLTEKELADMRRACYEEGFAAGWNAGREDLQGQVMLVAEAEEDYYERGGGEDAKSAHVEEVGDEA